MSGNDDPVPADRRLSSLLGGATAMLGRATRAILGPAVRGGLAGLLLGSGLFFLLRQLVTFPDTAWVWALLPYYALTGALGLGAISVLRGVGRLTTSLADEHQLARKGVERVLDLLEGSQAASQAGALVERLPLEQVQSGLRAAIARLSSEEDEAGGGGLRRRLFGWVGRYFARKLERYLQLTLAAEAEDGTVSLVRLREHAIDRAEAGVAGVIESTIRSQCVMIGSVLLLLWLAPPFMLRGDPKKTWSG